jgi:hypothetical protein
MSNEVFGSLGENAQSRSVRIARWLTLTAALVAVCLFHSAQVKAQDPQEQDPPSPPSAQSPQPPTQHPGTQPTPSQGGADSRPVTSRDTFPQDQDSNDNAPPVPRRRPHDRPRSAASAPANAPVPANLTIPAGTVVFARLSEPLSSDHNQAGDTFTATLDKPIIVDGWVVARRGETIIGNVTTAQKAGRIKGVSQLGLELTDLTVVDGQQLPILTELWKGSGGTSHGTDAAGIATTTGVGTIIGAAADGGAGAGIGAGAGAAAGLAMVLLTRGKPTLLGPEALLSFRLTQPLTISTTRSQQAFLPVAPNDYGPPPLRRQGDTYVAYPAPPSYYTTCGPYACAPYYDYGYWPAFGFAYYGGYGYRGGFYRGGFYRGFRR